MTLASSSERYAALAQDLVDLGAPGNINTAVAVLKRIPATLDGTVTVVLPPVNQLQPFGFERVDLLQQWVTQVQSLASMPTNLPGLPLIAAGRPIGSVQASPEVDPAMLTLLASVLSSEFERWRLVQAQQQEAARRSALAQLAITANAQTDVLEVLREAYSTLHGPLAFNVFLANIYDPATDQFMLTYLVDNGEETIEPLPQVAPNSLTDFIVHQRRPLRVDDMVVDLARQFPEIVPQIAGTGAIPHGLMGVPMMIDEAHAMGMIAVQAYDTTRYTERDQRFLEQVATTLAVAVQKALLFAERNSQITVLEAQAALGAELMTVRDVRGALQAGLRALQRSFNRERNVLYIIEPNGTLGLQLLQEGSEVQWHEPRKIQLSDPTYAQRILETKQSIQFNTDGEREALSILPVKPINPNQPPIQSLTAAPLLTANGHVLGVVAVQSTQPRSFDQRTMSQLESIARQLALVLQIARLLEDQATQVSELTQSYEQQRQLYELIRELGSPVVPVYPGVLALPLIGTIDSNRAQAVMERLLESIVAQQADVVIIDITGVPVVDTNVANYILQAARAVKMLGSEVLLTGISASVAQTIVQLGVSLSDITTCADLAAGLMLALEMIGREIL